MNCTQRAPKIKIKLILILRCEYPLASDYRHVTPTGFLGKPRLKFFNDKSTSPLVQKLLERPKLVTLNFWSRFLRQNMDKVKDSMPAQSYSKHKVSSKSLFLMLNNNSTEGSWAHNQERSPLLTQTQQYTGGQWRQGARTKLWTKVNKFVKLPLKIYLLTTMKPIGFVIV